MSEDTISEAFFEAKYQSNPDPWHFANDVYEKSRYSAVLAALNGRYFERAFEPGCSIGILTEQLAHMCSRVEALEISATAAASARQRCQHLENVTVRHGALPQDVPSGRFDLIVFSEIGYYFDAAILADLANELVSRIAAGGVLVAAHWLGTSSDHRLSGDEVHEILGRVPGLATEISERHESFRLQKWTRL